MKSKAIVTIDYDTNDIKIEGVIRRQTVDMLTQLIEKINIECNDKFDKADEIYPEAIPFKFESK